MRVFAAVAVMAWVSGVAAPAAEQNIRTERVQFGNGKNRAVLKGTLKGDQIVDYILTAAGGQAVVVSLQPTNLSTYFNITAAGADAALFIGSTVGNRFEGPLPKAGDYTVRVYQMRSAARRGEISNYTITFQVGGGTAASKPAAGAGPAKDDAEGAVKCSAVQAKLDKYCDFRVIRKSGDAEIWIVNAASSGANQHRILYYSKKVFTTNDGGKLAWQRQDDNWWVSVNGREFYLIPDALIFGG